MNETGIWWLIAALGLGTYAIRFSFLGLLGERRLPGWAARMLRYTPVAVLPGIVAPALIDGGAEPLHLAAVAATVGAGWLTRSALWGMLTGVGTIAAAAFL